MKKMKFLALGMALLSMVGFTSCLNSSNNGTVSAYAYLEVTNYLGSVTFTDASGIKVVPNTTVTTPTSKLVYAYMQYDQSTVKDGMTSLSVSNFQYANLTEMSLSGSAPADTTVTFSLTSSAGVFGQNKYLIVPVTFYMKASSDTDQSTELSKHHFYAYADEETDLSGGVLTIHLRQTIDGLSSSLEGKSIDQIYTNSKTLIMYFNLSSFANMSNGSGTTPTKVRLAYQYGTSAGTIAPDAEDQQETYSSEISLASSSN